MYHDECKQGWCEDDGTLIVYDKDLRFKRQSIRGFLRERQPPIEPTSLKTLLDFLRDNDGVLFYDKGRDAMCLATNNNNTRQRILSVGACYTAWHPLEESCDNGKPFASESIRLSIRSLNELETAQHGDKTDVQKGD